MRSMTGFGQGTATARGLRVTVEISSVNRKGFEASVFLPDKWSSLESVARELLASRASRGRITTRMTVERTVPCAAQPQINLDAARRAEAEFHRVARALDIPYVASLDRVLGVPGVVTWTNCGPLLVNEALGLKALKAAIADWEKSCLAEGKKLATDMRQRLERLRTLRGRVLKASPKVIEAHRKRLAARLKEAGAATQSTLFQEVLRTELAVFADRCDITEELTRLDVHLQRFDTILSEPLPGRRLDFLLQEMHREINTTGSKANDSGIAQDVVEMKTEVERLREQVQNLE
jgi:uncharacterized protein (TIGR00255 family)